MKFAEFERLANQAFEAIPEEYRRGVDGLVVSREAVPHPSLPDIYTLGHCDTESYPSDWSGPDTVRSVLVLYWGSFRSLSRSDPDFDWEAEIHETVEHELKHHLESLAGQDELEDVDYAMDESFKRGEGLEFDPWYYQRGEVLKPGTFVVEDQVYVEQLWTSETFLRQRVITFPWRDRVYEFDRPDELADLHFVWVRSGLADPPAFLEVVLVRRRSWWEDVRRLFGTSRPHVLESETHVRPVSGS